MTSKTLQLKTPLGYTIGVTKFIPQTYNRRTVVISSATGVLQKYYSKIALYFASLGYVVYTFDYYGIGSSNNSIKALKQNTCDLKTWSKNDQASVVKFAKDSFPDHTLTLLTHSLGGQLIAFNTHYNLIDSIITVASQSGYYKLWQGLDRFKMNIYWNALIPLTTALFGYFPTKKMGLFENLPKKATQQWRRWANHPNYMLGEFEQSTTNFSKITCPILALSFPRDFYAPKASVDWLANQYTKTNVERRHIIPEDLGIPDVKHFGFFRDTYKESLWHMAHDWITN